MTGRGGYVLAGGQSSRMGRNKALLSYHGMPLVRHVARAVALCAGSVWLVGDPQVVGHLGFPVLPDLYPGEGPLGGIVTALRDTQAAWNFVTACDMPELDAETVEILFRAAEGRDAAAFLPIGPSGRPEPLCAVYHRRCLEVLEHSFAGGTRKIAQALAGLCIATAPVVRQNVFQNVNTPEDWAIYAAE